MRKKTRAAANETQLERVIRSLIRAPEDEKKFYCLRCKKLIRGINMWEMCDATFSFCRSDCQHINAKGQRAALGNIEGARINVKSNLKEIAGRDRNNHAVKSEAGEKIDQHKSSDSTKVDDILDFGCENSSAKEIREFAEDKNYGDDWNATQDSGIDEATSTPRSTPSGRAADAEEAEESPPKTFNQRFVDLLDFQRDIYDLSPRGREMQIGVELCLETDSGAIYCLVCRKIVAPTLDNYAEHHCSRNLYYYLERKLSNDAASDGFAGRFSEIVLAAQYMQSVSETLAKCLVCHVQTANNDRDLESHVNSRDHRENWGEMRERMRQNFAVLSSRLRCDWYKVHKYSCLLCSEKFDTELGFAEHERSERHAGSARKAESEKRALIHEFCNVCALLWCGYRGSYAAHCKGGLHKWHARNGGYTAIRLPESARRFLEEWGSLSDAVIDHIDAICTREERKNEAVVWDLGKRVKMMFPHTKVCAFGLRITTHCVINVFLGCGKMTDGRIFTEDQRFHFMTSVYNWLSDDPQAWDAKAFVMSGRSPVISATHRPSGLPCDISFDNGFMIGGTKYIDLFDEIFPASCKLMRYLIQWLAHCELTGSQRISCYVLYWCEIFYLQKASILPSVAALMAHAGTQKIDDYRRNSKIGGNNCGLKKLVIGFFKFYANFDFRHDVACPLIGDVVQRRSFAYPADLPAEMAAYVAYVKNFNDPEEFPVDSPMCIQDPFSLNRNIGEAVSKVDLCNFRTYCAKTADYLCAL